ncbi:hypothetical protein ACAG39_05425 [Caldicellulosiruptoraceae bacterium PP1]
MFKMNKYIVLIISFIFLATFIAVIQYEKPYKVNKSFSMFDFNGIVIDSKKQAVEIKKLPQKYEVNISLSVKKNIFSAKSYYGSAKINGIEYIVYPKWKAADKNSDQIIPFVNKDKYYNKDGTIKGFSTSEPIDLFLSFKNYFEFIEISFVDHSKNKIKDSSLNYPYLFGPAKSFEEALRKYCQYIDAKLSDNTIKEAVKKYNKLNKSSK